MPDLEEKIASLSAIEAVNTSPMKKREAAVKKINASAKDIQPNKQQGFSGFMKGWFWSKK